MKSMYSGTPASVALPERSSRGITRSTRTRTVSHSCGVKKAGANGVFAASASHARVAARWASAGVHLRSEEHTSELQSQSNLVCRLLLEKKKVTAGLPLNSNECANARGGSYSK